MSTEDLPYAMDLPVGKTLKQKTPASDLKRKMFREDFAWTFSFAKIAWQFIILIIHETGLFLLESQKLRKPHLFSFLG